MDEISDWRLTDQKNYLNKVELLFSKYEARENWDHDHCVFCWDKFISTQMDGIEVLHTEGYCTLDKYHWICRNCFNDFKEQFDWKLKNV
jgi:hypothetical protein